MKNYHEMANDVFRRRDEYEIAQKKRRKTITKAAASSCCLCLAVLIGLGVWKSGNINKTEPLTEEDALYLERIRDAFDESKEEIPDNPEGNSTVSTPENKDAESTQDKPIVDDSTTKHLFAINEISGVVSGALKYRDPALHYKETWDTAKMAEYLGVDLKNAIIALPSGMEMKYEGTGQFTVTYQNDGTLVEDAAAYVFTGKDGQKVTILASRLGVPYDCLYQLETENRTPIRLQNSGDIISVLIAAQNKSETTMDYELYVADFAYNGIHYRIKTEHITAYQLDALIREIVD